MNQIVCGWSFTRNRERTQSIPSFCTHSISPHITTCPATPMFSVFSGRASVPSHPYWEIPGALIYKFEFLVRYIALSFDMSPTWVFLASLLTSLAHKRRKSTREHLCSSEVKGRFVAKQEPFCLHHATIQFPPEASGTSKSRPHPCHGPSDSQSFLWSQGQDRKQQHLCLSGSHRSADSQGHSNTHGTC